MKTILCIDSNLRLYVIYPFINKLNVCMCVCVYMDLDLQRKVGESNRFPCIKVSFFFFCKNIRYICTFEPLPLQCSVTHWYELRYFWTFHNFIHVKWDTQKSNQHVIISCWFFSTLFSCCSFFPSVQSFRTLRLKKIFWLIFCTKTLWRLACSGFCASVCRVHIIQNVNVPCHLLQTELYEW